MTDIKTMSLEELIGRVKNDLTSIKSTKIRIEEFKFFVTSTLVYDDYYLLVGPRGGVSICYGSGKQLHTGWYPITSADLSTGVSYRAPSNWEVSSILPSAKDMPKILAEMEKGLVTTIKKYEKVYTSAQKRLTEIQTLAKEYPEYSL